MPQSSILFGIGLFGQAIYLGLSWLDGYTLNVFPGMFMVSLLLAFLGMFVWVPCSGWILRTMFLNHTETRQNLKRLLQISILIGAGVFVFSGNIKFQGMAYRIKKHTDLEKLYALGMRHLAGDTDGPEFASYDSRYSREEIRVPVILKDIWHSPPHDVFPHVSSESQPDEILYIWKRFFGCDGIMMIPKGKEPGKMEGRKVVQIRDGVYLVSQ